MAQPGEEAPWRNSRRFGERLEGGGHVDEAALGHNEIDANGRGPVSIAQRIGISREEDKLGLREDGFQGSCGLDAVHARQPEVEQHEVWLKLLRFRDGLRAAGGFAANSKRGVALEENANDGADVIAIVNNQNGACGEIHGWAPNPGAKYCPVCNKD